MEYTMSVTVGEFTLTGVDNALKYWEPQQKHTTDYTNQSKHTTNYTNEPKVTGTEWVNQDIFIT